MFGYPSIYEVTMVHHSKTDSFVHTKTTWGYAARKLHPIICKQMEKSSGLWESFLKH